MSKNGSDQARTATVVLAPLGDDPAGPPRHLDSRSGYPDRPGARQRSGSGSATLAARLGGGDAPTSSGGCRSRTQPSRPMTH